MKINKLSKNFILFFTIMFVLLLSSCDTTEDGSKLRSLTINSEGDVTTLKIEETLKLSITKEPNTAVIGRINWESSDEEIAIVSKSGVVTAINSGTVDIYASYQNITGKITITVLNQVDATDNLFPEVEMHKVFTEYNETTDKTDSYIYMGVYPQSVVKNQNLILALNNTPRLNNSDIVEYKNHRYLAVTITNKYAGYRDWRISDERYPFYTGFEVNKVEYFRIEPIKWKIIYQDSTTNNAMLIAQDILDCKPFLNVKNSTYREINGNLIYDTNYEYSDIRNWLNNYFYKNAFSLDEQSYLLETLNSNEPKDPIYQSKYPTNDTIDKVYLPSYDDVTNPDYGFDNFGYASSTRRAENSDYARSQGATVTLFGTPAKNNGLYTLRFGLNTLKDYVAIVSFEGYVSNANGSTSDTGTDEKCFYVDAPSLGIRPCCNINLTNFK